MIVVQRIILHQAVLKIQFRKIFNNYFGTPFNGSELWRDEFATEVITKQKKLNP